jgi:hypothetical protein
MRILLALLLVAVAALTTYAGPPACEADCITISVKEYIGLKVSLFNSEADFVTCSNRLQQNQAANRFVMPEEMGEPVLPARAPR